MIPPRLGFYWPAFFCTVAFASCGGAPGSSSGGPDSHAAPEATPGVVDQTAILAATLKALNLSNPVADLDANLARGDRRFIGLYGIVCAPPDLNSSFDGVIARFGIRCLSGTSDAIQGATHAALIDSARRYANAYNWELLHRIRDGRVT
jgi:hypothetical protein